jgi:hypothetical protein
VFRPWTLSRSLAGAPTVFAWKVNVTSRLTSRDDDVPENSSVPLTALAASLIPVSGEHAISPVAAAVSPQLGGSINPAGAGPGCDSAIWKQRFRSVSRLTTVIRS